jgi:hypothetical protein
MSLKPGLHGGHRNIIDGNPPPERPSLPAQTRPAGGFNTKDTKITTITKTNLFSGGKVGVVCFVSLVFVVPCGVVRPT